MRVYPVVAPVRVQCFPTKVNDHFGVDNYFSDPKDHSTQNKTLLRLLCSLRLVSGVLVFKKIIILAGRELNENVTEKICLGVTIFVDDSVFLWTSRNGYPRMTPFSLTVV